MLKAPPTVSPSIDDALVAVIILFIDKEVAIALVPMDTCAGVIMKLVVKVVQAHTSVNHLKGLKQAYVAQIDLGVIEK
ncbi:hypothetical protein BGZ72_004568 [Mortierella alpina]|nr:hypothetical protein BGZ72_004568 [Mortierella alpina]